jgi:drug/metabolite transporter (DMT)-like permease
MSRYLIWGVVMGLVGVVLHGKSSYESGWLSLVQGGGMGFALGFAVAYVATALRNRRKRD